MKTFGIVGTFRVLGAAALLALGTSVLAQSYPSRPIKILSGFSPGGAPDSVLRMIATALEKRHGMTIVVENRPGASGTIAAAAVARAQADGYTLLFGVAANLAVAPAFMKHPPYDPVTAFTPIAEVARGPYLWLVRADAPAKSMSEFVSWANTTPGKLNYASPGLGTVHHLATEMLKSEANIDMVHVPYVSRTLQALLAGEVSAMFDSMPAPLPFLSAGRLRALAVTGNRRLAALPDVPTLAEQGIPGIDVHSWWGFVGPAGLPTPVAAQLNAAITAALKDPTLLETLAKMGIEPSQDTPEAFAAFITREAARWKAVRARSNWMLD